MTTMRWLSPRADTRIVDAQRALEDALRASASQVGTTKAVQDAQRNVTLAIQVVAAEESRWPRRLRRALRRMFGADA